MPPLQRRAPKEEIWEIIGVDVAQAELDEAEADSRANQLDQSILIIDLALENRQVDL